MVQIVEQQGDIFGRIGKGLGRGLSEQIPKEVERYKLSSGLRSLEQEVGNLTPLQQLTRLSSIPGVTPQMVQSFGELARIQNQRNSYRNRLDQSGQVPTERAEEELQEASPDQKTRERLPLENQVNPAQAAMIAASSGALDNRQRTSNVRPEERTAEIVNENPLNPAALTRLPWTPQQRDARILDYANQGFLIDKAEQLASDDEARDLAEPEAYQKRLDQLNEKSDQARQEFRRQLETKLQKSGEGVFKDVTGEMLANMERGMERDLRERPNSSFKDVANDWSNRALNVAKAKDQLSKMAQTTGLESLFKGDQDLNKLRSYQEIFKKAGNSEEYYNLLRKAPEEGGFGLSTQGAAAVAFPETKKVKEYINSFKPNNNKATQWGSIINPKKIEENSIKAAIDIEKLIDADDSLLTIARSLSEKSPSFNQNAFFKQLNEDQDLLRLNDRQRRELAEGPKDIIPTWGDVKYLPWTRRASK